MQFSEELSQLVDRFREVQVTFDGPARMPERAPDGWMQMNTSAAVTRFIASQFEPERTKADIRSAFGEVRDVTFNPMTLREIFLVMAKDARKAA